MRYPPICALAALLLILGACSDSPGKAPNSASNSGNDVANNASDGGAENNIVNRDGGGTGGPEVCEGFTAPTATDGECRSDADCQGGAYCASNGDSGGCGAGCPAFENCVSDADCEDGTVCQKRVLNDEFCCPAGTIESQCTLPCTPEDCRPDETCVPDGHCQLTSCEDGFVCAPDTVCAPNRALADGHGCAPPDCTVDDYDCPDGFSCEAASNSATNCEPIHCDDGYDCPVNSRCEGDGDIHGCTKLTCDADSSCDCGACVNGGCEPHVWVCAYPSA